MSSTGRFSGFRRRSRWLLLLAWVVAVADLLMMASLPRPVAHDYGLVLLGAGACSLAVVVGCARRLRRSGSPGHRGAGSGSLPAGPARRRATLGEKGHR